MEESVLEIVQKPSIKYEDEEDQLQQISKQKQRPLQSKPVPINELRALPLSPDIVEAALP